MEGTRGARVSTKVQKLTRIEYLEAEEGGGRDEGRESLHSLRHAFSRHGRLIEAVCQHLYFCTRKASKVRGGGLASAIIISGEYMDLDSLISGGYLPVFWY